MHEAYVRGDLDALKSLLAHGAAPAARTRIDDCETPLEEAERAGHLKAVVASAINRTGVSPRR